MLKRVVSLYHNHLETPAGHQKPKEIMFTATAKTTTDSIQAAYNRETFAIQVTADNDNGMDFHFEITVGNGCFSMENLVKSGANQTLIAFMNATPESGMVVKLAFSAKSSPFASRKELAAYKNGNMCEVSVSILKAFAESFESRYGQNAQDGFLDSDHSFDFEEYRSMLSNAMFDALDTSEFSHLFAAPVYA